MHVCSRNTNLFLPQTYNQNSQTGQRPGSKEPRLKKDRAGSKLRCEPQSSWGQWVRGGSEVMVLEGLPGAEGELAQWREAQS